MVVTTLIEVQTRGNADLIDLTDQAAAAVRDSGVRNGIATLFSPSSTCALTTIEYEPGALADLTRLFDEIAPPEREYRHNARWGDMNGHSHLRAALLGPSLTVPVVEGQLSLGTWQQIVFCDFDNRPRRRELVVQILGE